MANLPDKIEIGYSRTALLLLFLSILASSAASVAAALHWLPVEISNTFLPTLAYAWMIASSLGFLRLGWLLLAAKGSVLLIDRNGIRDVKVSNVMIAWDAVEKVSIRNSGHREIVTLKVTPAMGKRLVTPRPGRWSQSRTACSASRASSSIRTGFRSIRRRCSRSAAYCAAQRAAK